MSGGPTGEFSKSNLKPKGPVRLSPATTNLVTAKKWFEKVGGNLDGIIAKQNEVPYASGERTAMVKVKKFARPIVSLAGFAMPRSEGAGLSIARPLRRGGLLHHVGFTSAFKAQRPQGVDEKV